MKTKHFPTEADARQYLESEGWQENPLFGNKKTMTKRQAEQLIRSTDDVEELQPEELEAAFAAIFERPPDDKDREEGLWSHVCAAVDGKCAAVDCKGTIRQQLLDKIAIISDVRDELTNAGPLETSLHEFERYGAAMDDLADALSRLRWISDKLAE